MAFEFSGGVGVSLPLGIVRNEVDFTGSNLDLIPNFE